MMMEKLCRRPAAALAAFALLGLSACNSDKAGNNQAEAAAEPDDQSLAGALDDAGDLKTVSSALKDAGLAKMFEGTAPYTILAPQDSAFDAMGEAGKELRKPEQRAAMVAILRDHIVPGYLTVKDIGAALDRAESGGVKMKTMGGHVVTFTREGDAIKVASEDGSSAQLVGDPLLASNGAALPIGGVLKKL